MSDILVTKLQNILDDKIATLKPENLKKGVTALGVEGTLPEINNQDKEVTTNGIYNADEGYTGLGQVTVNVPSTEGIDTSDATAKSEDLVSPKTAYVNGEKITGSIQVEMMEMNDPHFIKEETIVTVPSGYCMVDYRPDLNLATFQKLYSNSVNRNKEGYIVKIKDGAFDFDNSFVITKSLFPEDADEWAAFTGAAIGGKPAIEGTNLYWICVVHRNTGSKKQYVDAMLFDIENMEIAENEKGNVVSAYDSISSMTHTQNDAFGIKANPYVSNQFVILDNNGGSSEYYLGSGLFAIEIDSNTNKYKGYYSTPLNGAYSLTYNVWTDEDGTTYLNTFDYSSTSGWLYQTYYKDGSFGYMSEVGNNGVTLSKDYVLSGTWIRKTNRNSTLYKDCTEQFKDLTGTLRIYKFDGKKLYIRTEDKLFVYYYDKTKMEFTYIVSTDMPAITKNTLYSENANYTYSFFQNDFEYYGNFGESVDKIVFHQTRQVVKTANIYNTLVLNTKDATATADHILQGETAYVNGEKVIGTLVLPTTQIFTTIEEMNEHKDLPEDTLAIVYGTTYVGTYRLDNGEWTQLGNSSDGQQIMDNLNKVMNTEDQYEGNGGTDEEINQVLDNILRGGN